MNCEKSLIFMASSIKSPASPLKLQPKFPTQNNLTVPCNPHQFTPNFQLSSKNIKFVGFKVKNTFMQIRARSNSPKMEDLPEIKNNELVENEKNDKNVIRKKMANFCKELQYLQKNDQFNRKGFDICLQILEMSEY